MRASGYRYPVIRRRINDLKIALEFVQKQIDAIYSSDAFLHARTFSEFVALEHSTNLIDLETQRDALLQRFHLISDSVIMHSGDRSAVIQYLSFVLCDRAEILMGKRPDSGTVAEYIVHGVENQKDEARYMLDEVQREWQLCRD